jgi:hypothetical protein
MVTIELINHESYLDRPVRSCYLFSQKTEDRGQNTEIRRQKTAIRRQKLEFGKRNGEAGIKKSKFEMGIRKKSIYDRYSNFDPIPCALCPVPTM